MQIIKDGNNILIKGIKNGDNIPLKEIGINKRTKIKLLWTIMDEKNIYICFDPQTGKKQQRQLKDVTPIQHKNAFVEDVIHDWNILDTKTQTKLIIYYTEDTYGIKFNFVALILLLIAGLIIDY